MTIEEQYTDIAVDDNLSVKEKIEKFEELYEIIKKENAECLDTFRTKIQEGYKWCPKCKDYYRENTFELAKKEVLEEECTNQLTGGYLDPYEYRPIYNTYLYYICPKGHWNQDRRVGWRYPKT